jgi:hypothetical protein
VGQHPIHCMLEAAVLTTQCRVRRPVKTKSRACISSFFYIVTTMAIGQKTGGGEGFCHGDYHGSGQNTVLRLMGFCHGDYHGPAPAASIAPVPMCPTPEEIQMFRQVRVPLAVPCFCSLHILVV